jgi:hypothetical protein
MGCLIRKSIRTKQIKTVLVEMDWKSLVHINLDNWICVYVYVFKQFLLREYYINIMASGCIMAIDGNIT